MSPTVVKRLPAYGRDLLRKRAAGLAPANGHIWVVNRFNFPRWTGWHCVVPDEIDPLSINFRFVAGLEVTIITSTLGRLDATASAIARHAPKRLVGACSDPARLIVYVKPS